MKQFSNTYTLLHHSHGDHVHFNLRKKSDHEHSHGHHHDEYGHDEHASHHDHHKEHHHDHEDDHNHHKEHHHDHEDRHDHHEDHDHHNHDEHCEPCEDGHSSSKQQIGKNDEGCPCCAAAIDLDEVATALNEISAKGGSLESHEHSLGDLADFSSAAHWGIFLGISGPLSLIGLTAAFRNIKGTINNKSKLDAVIKGLKQDITGYKERRDKASGTEKQNLSGVIQRLEAFEETLKYSEFDTKFNLAVPGFINGAASTAVLSSAIVSSPWALPVIALYAGCQTVRNGYDLWRTWNKILPEEIREGVQLNVKVGVRKINQITDSKRKFYAANTLGFAAFTAGAAITTLSALSVVGAPGLIAGIPLLAAGAVSTGITNNIWTNKFKPRNGDLGIARTELDLESVKQEIAERREIKKILKNYRDKHLPSKAAKRFGCSLLSSMPFGNKKGAKLLHEVNQSRISESDSGDSDRLDLLERIINAKIVLKKTGNQKKTDALLKKISGLEEISEDEKREFGLVIFTRDRQFCKQIFESCRELEIDAMVLDRFIKNAILKSSDEHDSSIKTKEDYFDRLKSSGLFTINGDDVTFNLEALEKNEAMKKAFMNSLEECLLFDYVEKLKYEQYGLNDFYWALDKQNKKQPHSHDHKHHKHHRHHHDDHHHDHKDSFADKEKDHSEHHKHSHHVAKSDVKKSDTCHESLCRPIHLPSAHDHGHHKHQEKKPSATHDHQHDKHHDHKKHTTSDSKPSKEDQKSTPPENEQKLLSEFKSLSTKKISKNKTERKKQIREQNEIIDKVLEKGREFTLGSQFEDPKKNQTFFIYLDPNHVNEDDPDYKEKQVIYIRDNATGKIDVIYGAKAHALVIERPNEVKNGVIVKIDEKKVDCCGEINNDSTFRSFEKVDLSKGLPTGGLRKANSRSLAGNDRSLVYE